MIGEAALDLLRAEHYAVDWVKDGAHADNILRTQDYDLVVLDLATGRQLSRQHAGQLTHFPSQVVSGDWVFVPTLSGVTAFRGR